MKPILFNTEMVKAILDNRKTVTRRAVKPKYSDSIFEIYSGVLCEAEQNTPPIDLGNGTHRHKVRHFVECKQPYQKGDILYVRETWTFGKVESGENEYGESELYVSQCLDENDYIHKESMIREDIGIEEVVWKPSIHMPKEAARIFLRVTDVRVERLQDITAEQIEKEGVTIPNGYCYEDLFSVLWDSTLPPNKNKFKCPENQWRTNPWVWVIEFERCEKEKEKPTIILNPCEFRFYSKSEDMDFCCKDIADGSGDVEPCDYCNTDFDALESQHG